MGLGADDRVRSVWDDVIERDGQMLVLSGNEVSLLSIVATEIARAAHDGITLEALADHLVEVFGPPQHTDGVDAVREIIDVLMQRGVMVIERPR
ncbi:hypothetical protein [Demequina mangrovi]|nr:hypothetical protein [Demequina mangrovi]